MTQQDEIDAMLRHGPDEAPGDGIPRDHMGRYILPSIDGSVPNGHWSRVTTVAKTIDDVEGLTKWKIRKALEGMAKRPDLVALAVTAHGDKDTMRDVAEKAHTAAAGDASANLGTACHAAIVHAMLHPGDPVPEIFANEVAAAARKLREAGMMLQPHWSERVVLDEQHETAGTMDHLAEIGGGGPLVVVDVKTGNLQYAWLSIAQQLAAYASATHARDFEANTWEPLPAIRRDFALVLHVPIGAGTAALYVVNLAVGREALALSTAVRAIRKRKDIAAPYKMGALAAAQLGGVAAEQLSGRLLRPEDLAPVPRTVQDGPLPTTLAELAQQGGPVQYDGTTWYQTDTGSWTSNPEFASAAQQQIWADATTVGEGGNARATDGLAVSPETGEYTQRVIYDDRDEHAADLGPEYEAKIKALNEAKAATAQTQAGSDELSPAEQEQITALCKLSKTELADEAAKYGVTDVKRYKIKVATDVVLAMRMGPVATSAPHPLEADVPGPQTWQDAVEAGNPQATALVQQPVLPDHPVFAQPAVPQVDPVLLAISEAPGRTELAEIWQRHTSSGGQWTSEYTLAGERRLAELGI